jgi:hypothetical protein
LSYSINIKNADLPKIAKLQNRGDAFSTKVYLFWQGASAKL